MINKLAFISLLSVLIPLQDNYQEKRESFEDMLGVNAFEWNFLENPQSNGDHSQIYEPKMELIKSFGGVRHYLDWKKIEPEKGEYTFNPTRDGGWNLDVIYERSKGEGIDVLVCLKTCPDWLLKTYPENSRDAENVPMPYGADKLKPASYISQAKAAFQFAARYGANKNVIPSLVTISQTPRWNGDKINTVKIGTNLVKYIECDNERDKWWKGDKAHQTAEEYAANLSAFYDGHKGRLGKGVGVKAADPSMQVVMAGLALPDIKYMNGIVEWCRKNRGYKKNGKVDLCFDVINFHFYANDHENNAANQRTVGIAPELSEAGEIADQFVKVGNTHNVPVWVTESGYDINAKSPQRSPAVGSKSALLTQADWIIRTSLLFSRHQIKKLFFYLMYDDGPNSANPYATSGLVDNNLRRRPAANYFAQVKNLIGKYQYKRTVNQNPLVDEYVYQGNTIYALMMPTQGEKTSIYRLPTNATQAVMYQLNPSSTQINEQIITPSNGQLNVAVSETPVFLDIN